MVLTQQKQKLALQMPAKELTVRLGGRCETADPEGYKSISSLHLERTV